MPVLSPKSLAGNCLSGLAILSGSAVLSELQIHEGTGAPVLLGSVALAYARSPGGGVNKR